MRPRVLTKVDERRNAARFLGIPALLAHPRNLSVSRTHVEPAGRLRTGLLSVAVVIGLVIVVASSVDLAVSVGRGQPVVGTSTIQHLGPGYPAHHGLAGPSRVGTSAESWLGYPPHFGLAGPSRVKSGAVPIGIGEGYPAHYGLAGPSHVDDGG